MSQSSFVCTQLNEFKYCNLTPIAFICTQFNDFKYCYLAQTILFNIICLHTVKWFQILLYNTNNLTVIFWHNQMVSSIEKD